MYWTNVFGSLDKQKHAGKRSNKNRPYRNFRNITKSYQILRNITYFGKKSKIPVFSTPFGYYYMANIFLIDKQLTKRKVNSNKE